jgi:cysteine desulfurase
MGLSAREADDSIRVSLGRGTTDADVDALIDALPDVVATVRRATR